jgi:hypothetical protein
MSISRQYNKSSPYTKALFDYDQELREIWRSNLQNVNSEVLCENCNTIDDIKQQIYLNKAKRKSGLLMEVMLEE